LLAKPAWCQETTGGFAKVGGMAWESRSVPWLHLRTASRSNGETYYKEIGGDEIGRCLPRLNMKDLITHGMIGFPRTSGVRWSCRTNRTQHNHKRTFVEVPLGKTKFQAINRRRPVPLLLLTRKRASSRHMVVSAVHHPLVVASRTAAFLHDKIRDARWRGYGT
jgi:hypothetical protein